MAEPLFVQAAVYLAAAVIAVPIAKRFGLGSVLGYLLAGVIVGPFALDLVGDIQNTMHFAEFGVVMMLFLIGLELRPALLWSMRGPILGLGGLQVLTAALLLAGVARFVGLSWNEAAVIGAALGLSSTAIVLQSLDERGLSKSTVGQRSFAVLLFQDIAVIPLLALIPLLAVGAHPSSGSQGGGDHGGGDHGGDGHGSGALLLDALPGWAQPLAVLAVVASIVIGGRFLMRPALRFIAGARLREIFTATALLLVVGVALAMQAVGLSPALGTFLAGVVLAESEYSRELEADIEPFKGLLLGLFFISVGASIDFALLGESPVDMLLMVALLMGLKFFALLPLGLAFGLPKSQAIRLGVLLCQGGEFAFVLLSFAVQSGALGEAIAAPLVLVVALSMLFTPLLLIAEEHLLQPRFARGGEGESRDAEADRAAIAEADQSPVIIAGFGRFGVTVLRLLKANGVAATVLDTDPAQIEHLEQFGHKGFYGDARRQEMLEAAGAEEAAVLIVAVDDTEYARSIIETAQRHFSHLKIFVRARSMQVAFQFMREGADHVERETFGSALDMGVQTLRELGFRGHQATRAAREFRRHERQVMDEFAAFDGEHDDYVERARRRADELERLMRIDATDWTEQFERAWEVTDRAAEDMSGSENEPD